MTYAVYIAPIRGQVRCRQDGIKDPEEGRMAVTLLNKQFGAVAILRLVDEDKTVLLEVDGRVPHQSRGPLGRTNDPPSRWNAPYPPANLKTPTLADAKQYSLF